MTVIPPGLLEPESNGHRIRKAAISFIILASNIGYADCIRRRSRRGCSTTSLAGNMWMLLTSSLLSLYEQRPISLRTLCSLHNIARTTGRLQGIRWTSWISKPISCRTPSLSVICRSHGAAQDASEKPQIKEVRSIQAMPGDNGFQRKTVPREEGKQQTGACGPCRRGGSHVRPRSGPFGRPASVISCFLAGVYKRAGWTLDATGSRSNAAGCGRWACPWGWIGANVT